jgi:aminoglycoside phosphotransferase (APT) family kinase protein
MVPRALLRRAGQELDQLESAICAADGMRPLLVHGDYGTSNVALARATDGHWQVAAVFDFESAAPGDPVEDFVWTADHGLDSRIFGRSWPGISNVVGSTPTRRSGLPSTSSSTAWACWAGRGGPTGRGSGRRSGSSSRSWTALACACPAEHRPGRTRLG